MPAAVSRANRSLRNLSAIGLGTCLASSSAWSRLSPLWRNWTSCIQPCMILACTVIPYTSRGRARMSRHFRPFGGADGLADVTLGVLGEVDQEADHGRWQLLAADGAGFGE